MHNQTETGEEAFLSLNRSKLYSRHIYKLHMCSILAVKMVTPLDINLYYSLSPLTLLSVDHTGRKATPFAAPHYRPYFQVFHS